MSSAGRINGVAALAALALAVGFGAVRDSTAGEPEARAQGKTQPLIDADGKAVPPGPYHRIASGSVVADALLLELCEPDRILALSAYGAKHLPDRFRYAGHALLEKPRDAEAILALKPDLFLFHSFGAPEHAATLRENGVATFDLGEMRGIDTFLANARVVAALIGQPERGEQFAQAFRRRMDHIAAGLDPSRRRRGLYLSIYGTEIFGGAAGTSYHDVVEHAGLIDAAGGLQNWPQYSPERILQLNPDVIVTKPGMGAQICQMAGLAQLTACVTHAIVEVDSDVIDDPGLHMLDAAEQIYDRVYGDKHGH